MSEILAVGETRAESFLASLNAVFIYILSFIKKMLDELAKFLRWLSQELYKNPDGAITFMVVLGVLLT
jgi:hypothetical protein